MSKIGCLRIGQYLLLLLIVVVGAVFLCRWERPPREASDPLPRSLYQPDITDLDIENYLARVAQTIAAGEQISNLFGSAEDFRQMLATMRLTPDTVLADIGAGTGLLELVILENDLPCRRVYAVDIDPRAIEFLQKLLVLAAFPAKEKILPILSTMTDVSLPVNEVDIAAIISTTAFDGRIDPQGRLTVDGKGQACLSSLRQVMKAGGVIHYFNKHDSAKDPAEEFIRVKYSFAQAGFSLVQKEVLTLGDQPYIHLLFNR